ncbi:MAG TPA: hypothetical protein VKG24_16985 [Pseudolabrys sp.]|jgi:hypothetical protein|nr:hypothetical protein [Pseudolabrys sp.]
MQTSVFVARLIGPVMALVGVSLLANEIAFRKMAQEFLRSPALMFFSGMILMPAGLAVVLNHNVWVLDWRVIITLLGWIAVISGAVRVFAPDRITKFGKKAINSKQHVMVAAVIWVVIGAVLCYFGFRSGVMS